MRGARRLAALCPIGSSLHLSRDYVRRVMNCQSRLTSVAAKLQKGLDFISGTRYR